MLTDGNIISEKKFGRFRDYVMSCEKGKFDGISKIDVSNGMAIQLDRGMITHVRIVLSKSKDDVLMVERDGENINYPVNDNVRGGYIVPGSFRYSTVVVPFCLKLVYENDFVPLSENIIPVTTEMVFCSMNREEKLGFLDWLKSKIFTSSKKYVDSHDFHLLFYQSYSVNYDPKLLEELCGLKGVFVYTGPVFSTATSFSGQTQDGQSSENANVNTSSATYLSSIIQEMTQQTVSDGTDDDDYETWGEDDDEDDLVDYDEMDDDEDEDDENDW